ncbi:NAD-dependent succinate-semialdehyde dehydrogenase [Amphritea balenae]|uniref:NAD-dependent succinate-semialdehyde dehydrogenase n=1 Tax=Amphritea balenae TaxID=452629 RepID=A0A3P1SRI6_9GAMM|nr:NAD-dependent succinate-semialdehyde dehydrogenase [Amphritea balenae]RRC99275.1 NAD-dependent succinate-semialdehyde dehydrogenase [Amphritea balenae]GGK72463.1 succinate-semialdehyde dehydrogenase [Amphritea balenae]
MNFETRNPATGELLEQFDFLTEVQLEQKLTQADKTARAWASSSFADRAALLKSVAEVLHDQREALAHVISLEMGKRLVEAFGEVDKCASACSYYADNSEAMLQDEIIETPARKSLISYEPLGIVLAIMPWNFPLWQVFRCLVPTLMAGNGLLLKHAPNVPRCAKAIEQILRDAGAPEGLVTDLTISVDQSAKVIADHRVQGIAFTGSEAAGRKIAALAGQHLKKVVLELGGSDPFIVLDDADIDAAVEVAMRARFGNAGQICIAAKRFLVVPSRIEEFTEKMVAQAKAMQQGDPLSPETTIAPMARDDLREQVQRQVLASVEEGAELLAGGEYMPGEGFFFAPTVLANVKLGMTAYNEEIFGPVAAIVAVQDEADAIAQANATRFGLGASVWTQDLEKGEAMLRRLDVGNAFLNAQVASDIRMPFGGVKASGLGRELGEAGIREFCNTKSIWVA